MPFDKDFSGTGRAVSARIRGAGSVRGGWRSIMPSAPATFMRGLFVVLAAGADAGAIILASIASGTMYHAMFYEVAGMFESHVALGVVLAALFVPPGLLRKDYEVGRFLSFKGNLGRCFTLWNVSFLCMLILAFVTKTSADVSRGTVILDYATGFLSVAGARVIMARIAIHQARAGGVGARRVFLVGDELEIRRFSEQY